MCVRRKKQNKKKDAKKSAPPKTHHESYCSPANATASRRRATKHIPRVRLHSPVSIDPGFVEIGLVQLSQSVKTMNVTHTDRHRKTNKKMVPCTHPGTKRLFCPKGKKVFGRFVPSALPHYEEFFLPKKTASSLVERYMRRSCLVLAVGRVRSKEREGKKITRSPTKH